MAAVCDAVEELAHAAAERSGVRMAELDLSLILKERKQEPVLRSQRPDLYYPLVEL